LGYDKPATAAPVQQRSQAEWDQLFRMAGIDTSQMDEATSVREGVHLFADAYTG
jgi:hypothetical protein